MATRTRSRGAAALLVPLCLASCAREVVHANEREAPRVDKVELPARLEAAAPPLALAVAAPRETPRVAELRVEVGQRVEAGAILAVLEGAAEAALDIELARSRLQRAELAVKRAAQSYREDAVPHEIADKVGHVRGARLEAERLRTLAEEERIALRRAELVAERHKLRAPAAGVIAAVHARVGEAVPAERGLFSLTRDARVARGSLPWSEACARLRAGQAASFAVGEKNFEGVLRAVARAGSACELLADLGDAGASIRGDAQGVLTIRLAANPPANPPANSSANR